MPVKYNENSEAFKELLHDFLNFEETGFKPFGQNIGGADHYKSRADFWANKVGSRDAFRALAKRVAAKACTLIPNEQLLKHGYDSTLDKVVTNDKATKSKKSTKTKANEDKDDDDVLAEMDTNKEEVVDLTGDEDTSKLEKVLLGYKPGQMRKPYLLQYPTGNKVGIVAALDGDVEDPTSNKFKLSKDCKTVTRSRRVPIERMDAEVLLNGMSKDKKEGTVAGFGSNDLDIVVLHSAIEKRLKEDCIIRDENGDIWEPMDVIELPFPCLPTMVSVEGKAMKTFKVRKNKHGFRWASFWLVGKHAAVAAGDRENRRFVGSPKMHGRPDDASQYSYRTVHSNNDVPVKNVNIPKKKTSARTKHKMKVSKKKSSK